MFATTLPSSRQDFPPLVDLPASPAHRRSHRLVDYAAPPFAFRRRFRPYRLNSHRLPVPYPPSASHRATPLPFATTRPHAAQLSTRLPTRPQPDYPSPCLPARRLPPRPERLLVAAPAVRRQPTPPDCSFLHAPTLLTSQRQSIAPRPGTLPLAPARAMPTTHPWPVRAALIASFRTDCPPPDAPQRPDPPKGNAR